MLFQKKQGKEDEGTEHHFGFFREKDFGAICGGPCFSRPLCFTAEKSKKSLRGSLQGVPADPAKRVKNESPGSKITCFLTPGDSAGTLGDSPGDSCLDFSSRGGQLLTPVASRLSFPATGPPDSGTDFKAPGSLTHHRCRRLLEAFSKGS